VGPYMPRTNGGCIGSVLHHSASGSRKPRSFPDIEAETPTPRPPFIQSAAAQLNCSATVHCPLILSKHFKHLYSRKLALAANSSYNQTYYNNRQTR